MPFTVTTSDVCCRLFQLVFASLCFQAKFIVGINKKNDRCVPFCSKSSQLMHDDSNHLRVEDEELPEDVDVVTFLHRAGERYKEHLRMLQRQRRQEEMKHVTGKPFVSPFAEELHKHSAKKSEAVEERLHRLHAKRLEKEEFLRKKKQDELRQSEDLEISNKGKLDLTTMASELRSSRDPIRVTEKFIEDHKSNLQRLAKEAVERELREVQTGPKITALAATSAVENRRHGQSVENYLIAYERERQQKLYEKAQQKEQDAGTFKPEITRKAQSLQQADVVDRLYQPNNAAHHVYDEAYERDCTFAPRTNHSNDSVAAHYVSHHEDPYSGMPVHQRLYDNPPRSSKVIEVERNFTGTPRISETSRMIVERKRRTEDMLKHSEQPLAAKKKSPSPDTSSRLEADATFTFRPQLNQRSKDIWQQKVQSFRTEASKSSAPAAKDRGNKATSVREFLWKQSEQKKQQEIERIKDERTKKELQECSFKPITPARKINFTRERRAYESVDMPERGIMWSQARNTKLRQLRNELDQTEVADCTFHPIVHTEFPIPNHHTSNAPGFEVHLHRMDVARKLKDEAENRIVGRTPRGSGRRQGGVTVPVEFRFGRDRSEGEDIASLRPPINLGEWRAVRSGLEDDASPRDESYYMSQHQQVPASFYDYNMGGGHNNTTTFHVQHSAGAGSHVSEPSPVDYVLSNHQAILKALHGKAGSR